MNPSLSSSDTPARAGRPKSEAKRAAILDAATDLFLAHGLQGTSMDAVASAAQVSKQTVYSHFRNKDDLFRACIQAKVASHGFSDSGLTDHDSVRDALLHLVRRFTELVFDPEVLAMFRVVAGEAVTHPKIARLFYEEGPGATIRAAERFLARQAESGRLNIRDPYHAATTLLSVAKGEYHMRLMLNLPAGIDAVALDRHLVRTVDDFLTLYGPPNAPAGQPRL